MGQSKNGQLKKHPETGHWTDSLQEMTRLALSASCLICSLEFSGGCPQGCQGLGWAGDTPLGRGPAAPSPANLEAPSAKSREEQQLWRLLTPGQPRRTSQGSA